MKTEDQLTFPPGVVDEGPVRLPILHRGDGWLAMGKPSGISIEAAAPTGHLSLIAAIRRGIETGLGQFRRLGFSTAECVTGLDTDATGIVLIAGEQDAGARLRNALGSNGIEHCFTFVASDSLDLHPGFTCECNLPLAVRAVDGQAVVSHRSGKKCSTVFELVAQSRGFSVWHARTRLCRHHQIRLHALELGLRIAGESIYAEVDPLNLATLKGRPRARARDDGETTPALALHLGRLVLRESGRDPLAVVMNPPRWFEAALRLFGVA